MAAQRVPKTPQEINEWLQGTISVSELLLVPFKGNSKESLNEEYSPETCESESEGDFPNHLPVTIEWSQQLLSEHSDTTMEVDREALFLCETPHKAPLEIDTTSSKRDKILEKEFHELRREVLRRSKWNTKCPPPARCLKVFFSRNHAFQGLMRRGGQLFVFEKSHVSQPTWNFQPPTVIHHSFDTRSNAPTNFG